jgi:hypothetical protein
VATMKPLKPGQKPGRRMGPPPSTPNFKREPVDEHVDVSKLGPRSRIKTLAPQKTSLPPKRVGVPDAARAARGLSLANILRKQPRYIINSGDDCAIRAFKKTKTKGGLPAIVGATRDIKTKPVRLHSFQVIGLEKDKSISTQKKIKVSCSCEFHMYYCEYALWTWGAANIRFSNGNPAKVTNPHNLPVVCKHMAKVLDVIRQRND